MKNLIRPIINNRNVNIFERNLKENENRLNIEDEVLRSIKVSKLKGNKDKKNG